MEITTPQGTLEGENIEAILEQYGFNCLRGANLRGANLCGAILRGADLHAADLRGADLCGANLCGADLHGANLCGAILRGANLYGADLHAANLCGADLSAADLSAANLRCANLCGADLSAADLCGANLCGADLSAANLCGADLSELTIAQTSILPDEGDIIGWKKAYVDNTMPSTPVIVKLLIPSDAKRSNSTGRKCRASKAQILDLQDKQGNSLPPDTTAYSSLDPDFTYKKGETVHVENFDTNRWTECAPGIHFFITRVEAVEY